ncbi:unnamed protein product [Alopecurus aequalis]
MEKQANGAAGSAQEGDLADVVARANIIMASSSTSHHQPGPPPPRPPAPAHIMAPYEEELPQPMSFACGVGDLGMFKTVPPSSVVVDPYLLAASGSGLPQQQHQDQQQLLAFQISEHGCCGAAADVDAGDDAMRISPPPAPPHQIIKRKNDVRKVVCIPAPPTMSNRASGGGEVIPSDLWAWRKYGQKPIKGSPYPRGYYRCSSSKGCMARKQVERSRSDPNMLVITYTAEHNHPWPMHRNVLAGYARAHTQPASAKKQHKNIISADNVTGSSSLNQNNFHLEQNVICGDQPGNYILPTAGNGATTSGLMFEACNGVQPDEVFAELEELEPDNNSMMVSASVYDSRGVSSNYDWHKF